MRLDRTCLPADVARGAFAARVMTPDGPCVVGLIGGAAFDMTPMCGTMSRWMEAEAPAACIRKRGVPMAFDLDALLANSAHDARDPAKPYLLAPIDLQAVKAAGVTYVRSMLERVIEERCRGDASLAAAVRVEVRDIIGDDLAALVPGSAEEPVSRGRHRPGCRDLHQMPADGRSRHRLQGRCASQFAMVEPGTGSGDGGEQPRHHPGCYARQ